MLKNVKGYSLNQMLLTVAVVGILVAISLPQYQRFRLQVLGEKGIQAAATAKQLINSIYLDKNPNQYPPASQMSGNNLSQWVAPTNLQDVQDLIELLDSSCHTLRDMLDIILRTGSNSAPQKCYYDENSGSLILEAYSPKAGCTSQYSCGPPYVSYVNAFDPLPPSVDLNGNFNALLKDFKPVLPAGSRVTCTDYRSTPIIRDDLGYTHCEARGAQCDHLSVTVASNPSSAFTCSYVGIWD